MIGCGRGVFHWKLQLKDGLGMFWIQAEELGCFLWKRMFKANFCPQLSTQGEKLNKKTNKAETPCFVLCWSKRVRSDCARVELVFWVFLPCNLFLE